MGRLQERERMRGEMDRRVIYGDKALTAKIKKDYKIEEVIRPIGRPRKKGLKNRTVLI